MFADTARTRAFIIGDDRRVVETYEGWLADDYDVRTAGSGEAVLERMTEFKTDVVVLERRTPGLSGDEVATRLSENGYDAQAIVVTATLSSPETATPHTLNYVTKPIGKERPRSTVETATPIRTDDDDITELLALIARQQAVKRAVPTDERVASDEFDRLMSKIDDPQDSIDDTMAELWSQSATDPFAWVAGELTAKQVSNRRDDTPS